MIAPDFETAILRLRDLVAESSRIVPFTGAGISTECGIPDFRSPGGLWTKNQPIPFDAFMTSGEMRDEAWPAFRHGGEFRQGKTRPRPPRTRQPLPGRQNPGAGDAKYRQPSSRLRH